MKTKAFIITAALLMVLAPICVYGEMLEYSPTSSSVTIAPGASATIPLTLGIAVCESSNYYVWFVDGTSDSLPLEWISASPDPAFLWCLGSGSRSTTLTITVPEGTAGGVYGGYLYSKAMASHGYAETGDGVYIEVTVPSACAGTATVTVETVNPAYLWPPNGRMQDVTITGSILMPDGCTIFEAGFTVDDEYGVYTQIGTVTLGPDNSYTATIPLEVSRRGNDKDGRNYLIRIYAEDDAGLATSEDINVIVHDMGSSSGTSGATAASQSLSATGRGVR